MRVHHAEVRARQLGRQAQTKTFEDGSDVTSPDELEQAQVVLKHQKRQAAVVTIFDEAPDTGEGPILTRAWRLVRAEAGAGEGRGAEARPIASHRTASVAARGNGACPPASSAYP